MSINKPAAATPCAVPSRSFADSVHRIGVVFADVVLVAQAVGVAAMFLWYSFTNQSDAVGFAMMGGSAGGLLAYFGFFLFGFLYLVSRSRVVFWRTLHPFNFGMGIVLLFMHRFWAGSPLYLALCCVAGVLLAQQTARRVCAAPLWATFGVCTIVFAFARALLPWELMSYGAMFFASFLLTVPCLPASEKSAPPRQEPTVLS